jgi:hypothetical protein
VVPARSPPDPEELTRFVAGRLACAKVPSRWGCAAFACAFQVLKHVVTGDAENTFVDE